MSILKKLYERIFWRNHAIGDTALDEANLNRMDRAIDGLDDEVVELSATKLDRLDAQNLVRDVEIRKSDGMVTVTYFSGETKQYDTNLEKIVVNYRWDKEAQIFYIVAEDGTEQEVDLSSLIAEHEFVSSETIAFRVDRGTVQAQIKSGAVTEELLQPNFLADVRAEASAAALSASQASASEAMAAHDAKLAQSYSVGGSGIREGEDADNAREYSRQAALSASLAGEQAEKAEAAKGAAETSEEASAGFAAAASGKASEAADSAGVAAREAAAAANAAGMASGSAEAAEQFAAQASSDAALAQSWAEGGTGIREGEDTENAKYFSSLAGQLTAEAEKLLEQAKKIIAAASTGALIPAGTVAYAELPAAPQTGYMYNISDVFVTDDRFLEGAGVRYGAGANVYWTAEGGWDVLTGVQVTGVKGGAETAYRTGDVDLTAANLGLGNVDNTADKDKSVAYADRANASISADKAAVAAHLGKGGAWDDIMDFYWQGQDGQPAWIWGGNDGRYMYVYNPSNFKVNHAGSAGNCDTVDGKHASDFLSAGGGKINGNLKVGDCLELVSNHEGGNLVFTSADGRYGYETDIAPGNAIRVFTVDNSTGQTGALILLTQDGCCTGINTLHVNGLESNVLNVFQDGVPKHSVYSSSDTMILGCGSGGATVRSYGNLNEYRRITASSFDTASSRKAKENIKDLTEEEARKLLDIHVVAFDYTERFGGKKNQRGVIAEDVCGIIPSAVTMPEGYDETAVLPEDGIAAVPTVDYSKFVPYLIKMVQLQEKQITDLGTRLADKEVPGWST